MQKAAANYWHLYSFVHHTIIYPSMNIHQLLGALFLPLVLLCSSCHPQTKKVDIAADDTVHFKERFNGPSKATYKAAVVNFATGNWYLADAVVASEDNTSAVRIRNSGKLSMQFDVNSAQTVFVGYCVYKNDPPSAWQLWMSADGGNSYKQVGSSVTANSNSVQKTAFTINQNGAVRFEIRKTGGGKNRLLITSVAIVTGSAVATALPAPSPTSVAPAAGDNSNLLLGNPTNAAHSTDSAENYLVDHGYYIESYSKSRCIPNWVSWHIGAADLGSVDRLNNFRPDRSLPGGWYEADYFSYKGSGFDKGHNCPSGDRTASANANGATFFMDNIIPQAPNNNERTWEHLESYCRDEVKKGNEVYVMMGSYGSGGTGSEGYATSLDNGRITVPARIWKVVVIIPDGNNDLNRINSNSRVIAIDTPNDNSISPNWMNYVTTIAAIEKATGTHLLSALPDMLETTLKSKKFAGGN